MAASLNLTIASAQEKGADPYVAPKKDGSPVTAAAQSPSEPKNISICYEVFSVPLAMAAKLQRSQPTDPDLYAKLTSSVEKNEATQETFVVIRVKSGQKSSCESIQEMIYATEYNSAQMPNSVTQAEKKKREEENKDKAGPVVAGAATGWIAPATPSAFETRNVGFTLDVAPTLDADDKLMDLLLAPEHVVLAGRSKWGQGLSEAEMPEFESQRIKTSVVVWIDRPFFLGTMNPPPMSKANPDSAKRVWLAFVTATISK